MSPRKNKLSGAAHIKKNTAGSSNEVSLSVLDAAKLVMDERHGEARRIKQLGKIDLYSGQTEPDYQVMSLSGEQNARNLPVSKTPSTKMYAESIPADETTQDVSPNREPLAVDSYEYEVARKKAVRKFRNGTKVAVVCAVLVAIVACVVVGARAFLSDKSAFDQYIVEVASEIKESEAELVLVNDVLADPINAYHDGRLERAKEGMDKAEAQLDAAKKDSERLAVMAKMTRDKEAAFQVSQTIDGRLSMLESARGIFDNLLPALDATTSLAEALDQVEKSNEYAKSAANRLNQPTTDNLAESQSLMQQSVSCLSEAQTQLDAAKSRFPEADLSAFTNYLAVQTEAFNAELAAIGALIGGNTSEARAQQDVYEAKSAQAQALASALSNVEQPIFSTYEERVEGYIEDYEVARGEVSSADEYLRGYLG